MNSHSHIRIYNYIIKNLVKEIQHLKKPIRQISLYTNFTKKVIFIDVYFKNKDVEGFQKRFNNIPSSWNYFKEIEEDLNIWKELFNLKLKGKTHG